MTNHDNEDMKTKDKETWNKQLDARQGFIKGYPYASEYVTVILADAFDAGVAYQESLAPPRTWFPFDEGVAQGRKAGYSEGWTQGKLAGRPTIAECIQCVAGYLESSMPKKAQNVLNDTDRVQRLRVIAYLSSLVAELSAADTETPV